MDIEYIKRNCIATLEIEGLRPSEHAIKINNLFLNQLLTSKQAIEQIKKYYKV